MRSYTDIPEILHHLHPADSMLVSKQILYVHCCAVLFERQQMVMQAETGHKPGSCQGQCGGQGSCWVVKRGRLADTIDTRLTEGLKRLADHNSWTRWQWGPRHPTFYDVDSFRYASWDIINFNRVVHCRCPPQEDFGFWQGK